MKKGNYHNGWKDLKGMWGIRREGSRREKGKTNIVGPLSYIESGLKYEYYIYYYYFLDFIFKSNTKVIV